MLYLNSSVHCGLRQMLYVLSALYCSSRFFIKCQSDGYALIRAYTADGNRQLEVSADTAEFLRVKLHILPYFASVKFYIRSGVIVDVKYNFSRFCTIFFIC